MREKTRSLDYNAQLMREPEEIKAAQERGASFTAQEAADFAGVLMEKVYGLGLAEHSIRLYLSLTNSKTMEVMIGKEEPKAQRVIWEAELEKKSGEESSAQCTIDANSGKLLSCWYFPSTQEKESCISEEWMEFVTPQ